MQNKKEIAYIISPYNATGFWKIPILKQLKIAWNIYQARKVAIEYWHKGYIVLVPQLNSAFMKLGDDDKIFLDAYVRLMLKTADVVVINKGWEYSYGCCIEKAEAIRAGKVIEYYKKKADKNVR